MAQIHAVCSMETGLLTWFLAVLQTARNGAGVWRVRERKGKERPFLMGSGLRVKELKERRKSLVQRVNPHSAATIYLTFVVSRGSNSGRGSTQTHLQSDFQDFLVLLGWRVGSCVALTHFVSG